MENQNVNLLSLFNIGVNENNNVKKEETVVKKDDKKSKTKTKVKTNHCSDSTLENEKKLKSFTKVYLKAFGGQIKIFEGEELENIKLAEVQKYLVEAGFGEFRENVHWIIVEDENKVEAILVASCAEKFHSKG